MTYWEIDLRGLTDEHFLSIATDDRHLDGYDGDPVIIQAESEKEALDKFIKQLVVAPADLSKYIRTIEEFGE